MSSEACCHGGRNLFSSSARVSAASTLFSIQQRKPSLQVPSLCISCVLSSHKNPPPPQENLPRDDDRLADSTNSTGSLKPSSDQRKDSSSKGKVIHKLGFLHLFFQDLVGNMAPREKGDIRDVILMSLSFAVYVYISQKLVCAYCMWQSMSRHF
ncbi:hypothetical protein GOP47_0000343 [Adiantum capillus-veneris]|uniref:Uncharacterized protein n=1 Tax=Adiantum capillus-veneris TaxID=13818 RepID=A0A9D4ZQG6_ADICA|nr:hypothetical protein GOP47_0000343 [Adiantum capillus-veneris]